MAGAVRERLVAIVFGRARSSGRKLLAPPLAAIGVITAPAAILLAIMIMAAVAWQSNVGASQAGVVSPSKRAAVGHVDTILDDTVLLDGKIVTQKSGKAPLHSGDVFDTRKGGSVTFSLILLSTTCTVNPNSILVVRPSKLVSTTISLGGDWCYAAFAQRKHSSEVGDVTAYQASVGSGFTIKSLFAADLSVHPHNDAIVGVDIHPRTSIVIKVDRGFVVVTGFPIGPPIVVPTKKQLVVTQHGYSKVASHLHLSQKDINTIQQTGVYAKVTVRG
jgi:hypothetical protein